MRYLFAPIPFTGHVNPGLPIARELVARGHDVRWYSTPRFRRAIESTGARWVPLRHAMPLDEERLDELWPDARPRASPRCSTTSRTSSSSSSAARCATSRTS